MERVAKNSILMLFQSKGILVQIKPKTISSWIEFYIIEEVFQVYYLWSIKARLCVLVLVAQNLKLNERKFYFQMSAIDMFDWTEQKKRNVWHRWGQACDVNVIIVTCAECPLLLLMMTHEDEVDQVWTSHGGATGLQVHTLQIQKVSIGVHHLKYKFDSIQH